MFFRQNRLRLGSIFPVQLDKVLGLKAPVDFAVVQAGLGAQTMGMTA